MQRTTLNALLDAIAGLLFLGMVGTGFVSQFVLPPGSGGGWMLWGFLRHDWNRLHAVLGLLLLMAIAVHVGVHWKWIVQVVSRRFGLDRASPIRAAVGTVVIMLLLGGGFAGATFGTRVRVPLALAAAHDGGGADVVADGDAVGKAALRPVGDALSFSHDVGPIIGARCLRCHQGNEARGGVRLDGYDEVLRQIVPGASAQSPLITALRSPTRTGHDVDVGERTLIEAWVGQGAAP